MSATTPRSSFSCTHRSSLLRRAHKLRLAACLLVSTPVWAQLGPPRAEFFRPAPDIESLYPEDQVYPRGQLFPFSFFSSGGGGAAGEEAIAAELDRLRAAGIPLLGPQYELNARILDDAREHGMNAIYTVGINKPAWREGPPPLQDLLDQLRDQVSRVAEDTSIAWWYLTPEELRYWRPDEMEYLTAAVQTIRAADPLRRPIWMYEPGHRTAEHLAPIARHLDIVGKGMYTNYSSMRDTRVWCRWTIEQQKEAIAQANPDAIPIAVAEMFREPDPEQVDLIPAWVRHDAYLALVSGAKGIVIFSGRVRRNFPSRERYMEAWEQVARELFGPEGLGRVFLFGEPRQDLVIDVIDGPDRVTTRRLSRIETAFEYPSIHYLDVAYGSARYLVAVNSANEPVMAVLGGLPYGNTWVEELFNGNPGYVVAEGDVEVEFAPLEVKAFRITYPGLTPADLTPAQKLAERGFGVSPDGLMRAAEAGDLDALKWFREAGMDLNARRQGTTALMWAAGAGRQDAVAWLLENGAELHVADPDFWTPLLWAERGGHEAIAELFRNAGLTEIRIFE